MAPVCVYYVLPSLGKRHLRVVSVIGLANTFDKLTKGRCHKDDENGRNADTHAPVIFVGAFTGRHGTVFWMLNEA